MYVSTVSVSNMPIYPGNWKQNLIGWKLKVNFWTGGHYHDRENWEAQVFHMLLKCSGTEIVNANAAVTIKSQILSFCWNESSLFSYHLRTQADSAAALLSADVLMVSLPRAWRQHPDLCSCTTSDNSPVTKLGWNLLNVHQRKAASEQLWQASHW